MRFFEILHSIFLAAEQRQFSRGSEQIQQKYPRESVSKTATKGQSVGLSVTGGAFGGNFKKIIGSSLKIKIPIIPCIARPSQK